MLNNIFPFVVQAASQPVAQSPVVTPFQAAAAWINDEIVVLTLDY